MAVLSLIQQKEKDKGKVGFPRKVCKAFIRKCMYVVCEEHFPDVARLMRQ